MRVRKVHVVTALVLAGLVAGATSVYVAGRAIDARDRTDVLAWEARAAGPVADARRVLASLEGFATQPFEPGARRDLRGLRADLQGARNRLLEITIPKTLETAAAAYLSGAGFALQGLSVADDAVLSGSSRLTQAQRASFDDAVRRARDYFEAGDDALINSRCGAHLPDCDRI